ncbi:flavodoxin domain-containing protein [Alteromonas sp. a30]|uniref:flavodoxin domain-containing protein n=1 Tax=Alteromonas sp. a30 TaxID=2730917 RepID=UPI00227DFC3A|nr:flavodoxin domain-containing protein [Alteromonas sp. a30]MCY7294329.1 flavodoxin [Alteromonas sp. a30]
MSNISIFVGTVYGNAQNVAEQAQSKLEEMGHTVTLFDDPLIPDFKEAENICFITSTTGQGDFPPNIEFFIADLRDQMPMLNGKPFSVVALGDSSYGDSFAQAGREVYELMLELAGSPISELKIVDALETFNAEEEVLPWIETVYKA